MSVNQLCGVDRWGRGTYTSEGIKAIADALGVSGSLTSLDVSLNSIIGDAAQQLASTVLSKPTFENFCGIPLRELRENNLDTLNLNWKGIGVPGALVLADLLRVNASLTQVLAFCHTR